MYERFTQPPISRPAFVRRLAAHFGVIVIVILVSLAIGILGLIYFQGLPLSDAFLNSATLLGGMGLVQAPTSISGKLFAALFALYAGLVFLATLGIILAPIVHRILHKFHWHEDK